MNIYRDEVEEVFNLGLKNESWRKLRRNKEFFDLAFEVVYGPYNKNKQWEAKMKRIGGLELIDKVHTLFHPVPPDFEDEFNQVAAYLQGRGIEFQSNSEGPEMLVGFCTVLRKLLNLYPHELYHHFYRNVKIKIL